jgi:glycosyltransferase involved in cell wall biosynthesis
MKDIVIIANFCRDFSETDNGRFMYLCKKLSVDNKVEIITSDFRHSTKKRKKPLKHSWPFTITFLHEPGYDKNISFKRFYSHYMWGKEVEKYLKKRKKPDVIYSAVPSLTGPLKAAKFCEKNDVRFIIDIQDLWPEAFKLAFNVPVISDIIFAPFNAYVNGIYKRADEICAVSRTYAERAKSVNNKCSDTHVVFLGTELSTFDRYVRENPVEKPEDELWLGYCGTLGASYDITIAIDALAILNKRGIKTPKFIVLGDGERKAEFEQHAKELSVECLFTGRLPYEEMCGVLASCDIAVNPIMHNAAQSIINKHGDFAASGIPVLNTQECKEYRDLIKEYKMGFNCKNGDAEGLADRLQCLIEDGHLRLKMGKNARRCANEKFDRKNSYLELLSLF